MTRSASSAAVAALAPRPARAFVPLAALALLTTVVSCGGDAATGLLPSEPSMSRTTTGAASTNVLPGATLWVNPASDARRTGDAWYATRPADANMLYKLAGAPQAQWFGNWNANVRADVDAATSTIAATGAVPVFVAYNLPQRDCGGLSGGNTTTATSYRRWIRAFANGLAGRRATVILEPDALAAMDCLGAADQQQRLDLMLMAIQTLRASPNVAVYLDAGNPAWQSPETMNTRLRAAGIALAQGFALNVSSFYTTDDNLRFGQALSALTGGTHFIIDTSRNGLGPAADGGWCNPAGRAIGNWPTTRTGLVNVDAFLWIKTPGESDGACNGAPAAGTWMPEYALGLAQRASD
jgi:endoglucanase